MAIERRKDTKNRVLKDGEYQRSNGTYEYKWRDKSGKRHSIYAPTLDELRNTATDVTRDILNGIQVQSSNTTLNDMYYRCWNCLKRKNQIYPDKKIPLRNENNHRPYA